MDYTLDYYGCKHILWYIKIYKLTKVGRGAFEVLILQGNYRNVNFLNVNKNL